MRSLVVLILVSAFCVVLSSTIKKNGRDRKWMVDRGPLAGLIMKSFISKEQPSSLGGEKDSDDPGMDMADYVKFYLFTRELKDGEEMLTVDGDPSASHFNSSRKTVILIHGYLNDVDSEAIKLIKDALLATGDYNVVGVDWSEIAVTLLYNVAAGETRHVGRYVADLVQHLQDTAGLRPSDLHIVGHSLGAHVAGFTGAALKPQLPGRITGLDPAKPWFTFVGPEERLDAGDAEFVDCIHTCAGELGLGQPLCHADYYPNGGTNPQPGCHWIDFVGTCSHERSVKYYAESVYQSHLFTAGKCNGTSTPPNKEDCALPSTLMGHPASPGALGVFFVETKSSFAFATFVKK